MHSDVFLDHFIYHWLGTCVDSVNNYSCQCNAGFTGRNCGVRITNCSAESCYPNVSCFESNQGIYCGSCPLGLTGDGKNCRGRCEILFFFLSDCFIMLCLGKLLHKTNKQILTQKKNKCMPEWNRRRWLRPCVRVYTVCYYLKVVFYLSVCFFGFVSLSFTLIR